LCVWHRTAASKSKSRVRPQSVKCGAEAALYVERAPPRAGLFLSPANNRHLTYAAADDRRRIAHRCALGVADRAAGLLHQHSLLVSEAYRCDVPTAHAERDYAAREHVALPTHVLLPGLVNAHTHAAMSLLRASPTMCRSSLARAIDLASRGPLCRRRLRLRRDLACRAEMLRGGITCCNDMYFFPDAAARAYRASGMRAMLGLPVLDFPTPYAADADAIYTPGLGTRRLEARAAPFVFACAARSVYRHRRTWTKIVTFAVNSISPFRPTAGNARRANEESAEHHTARCNG